MISRIPEVAMKPTVSVILVQGDTSNVQSALETAASALQEASMKMSEVAEKLKENVKHITVNVANQPEPTSTTSAKKRPSNENDKIPIKHKKIAGECVEIVNQISPPQTMDKQKPKLLKDLRVVDLRSELGKRGLATTGYKADLAGRLKTDLKEKGQNIDTFNFNEINIDSIESNKTGDNDKKIPIGKACDVKEEEKPSKITDNQPSTSNLECDGSQNGDPCPVCFDKPLYPLKLPCDHIYCFLCAKGLCESNLSGGGGLCGMCRRPFSREIFKQSKHHGSSSSKTIGNPQDICWFYEGKCGWWKFDERNGEDIEQSFNTGVEKFQLLLCGKLYVIDFKNMIQYRVDGSGRVRCIKRDSASSSSKGIAGLTNEN